MRFSENRRLALIVLAVCILGSVFLLGTGSLLNERKALEKAFVSGTDASASTRSSMDAYLDKCAQSARLLGEAARAYVDDKDLIDGVMANASALEESEAIDGRYALYRELCNSVETLYSEISAGGGDEDTDVIISYGDFKGACDRMERDEYHALARQFNEDLGSFPANLLGGLFGIKKLDTYGW